MSLKYVNETMVRTRWMDKNMKNLTPDTDGYVYWCSYLCVSMCVSVCVSMCVVVVDLALCVSTLSFFRLLDI